ncbi:hypothetical protein ACQY74_006855 (plasmid) [Rhizobium leguminosarum bv. trifolii]
MSRENWKGKDPLKLPELVDSFVVNGARQA